MAMRDKGPLYNVGFGVNSREAFSWNPSEETIDNPDPNSGPIAKFLDTNPLVKFVAVGAATMVGAHIAGRLIKTGGIKVGYRAERYLVDNHKAFHNKTVKAYRDIQHQFDLLEGVNRTHIGTKQSRVDLDLLDEGTNVFVRSKDGTIHTDFVDDRSGFFLRREELRHVGRNNRESIPGDTYVDAIQRRLVSQARRLPYELPAAYIVNQTISNRVLKGESDSPNWSNPVDVITDFVTSSVRDVAFAFAPFEIGAASGGHAFRKFMSYSDEFANLRPTDLSADQIRNYKRNVAIKNVLSEFGHDATKIANRAVRVSSQSTGAIATALNTGQDNSVPIWRALWDNRNTRVSDNPNLNLRQKMSLWMGDGDLQNSSFGPLGNIGNRLSAGKQEFAKRRDAFAAYDKMLDMGGIHPFLKSADTGSVIGGTRVSAADVNSVQDYFNLRLNTLGTSGIEDIASAIAGNKHKFFQSQWDQAYKQTLTQSFRDTKGFIDSGLGDDFLDKVVNNIRFTAPPNRSSAVDEALDLDISKRIQFGGKPIGATGSEYINKVADRLTHFNDKERDVFRDLIEDVMSEADSRFSSESVQKGLKESINNRYSFFHNQILPEIAERQIGRRKSDYSNFINPTSHVTEDMQRKAAALNGLTDPNATLGDVKRHLITRGFKDPNDTNILRGYLTDKKAINSPWRSGGYGIFGFRQMSMKDANVAGIVNPRFKQGYDKKDGFGDQYDAINKALGKKDISPLEATIPGLYQHRSGAVFDLGFVKGMKDTALHVAATRLQIPILNFNPLEQMGYSSIQHIRERGSVSFVGGLTKQPFIDGQSPMDEMYVWAKGRRGHKGSVFSIRSSGDGRVSGEELAGSYKPYSATGGNVVSRHLRIAAGETGRAPRAGRQNTVERALSYLEEKNLLSSSRSEALADRARRAHRYMAFSDDQPESVFGFISRFRNRRGDLNRPDEIARRIASGDISEEVIESVPKLLSSIRRTGFSRNAMMGTGSGPRGMSGLSSVDEFEGLFSIPTPSGKVPRTLEPLVRDGRINVHDINTPDQLKDTLDILEGMAGDNPDKVGAFTNLLRGYRHRTEQGLLGHIQGRTPTSTVFNRIDEAKQDIYRYLSVLNDETFLTQHTRILEHLTKMRSAGALGQREFTESVTALLSIQADNIRLTASARGSVYNEAKMIAEGLSDDLLEPVAEGRLGLGGRTAGARSWFRRRYGSADYEYDGTEFNPFGGNTVLVPTARTAWARGAGGTLKSVFQINNWSEEGARYFSPASVPGGHIFERINRYADSFGLGLDPTQFAGGADFYLRGILGRRVLPIVGAGAVLNAADRTVGGLVNDRDENGERVYSPYLMTKAARGMVELQSLGAGLAPGGMGYSERKEQLLHGEVPIRSGRYWPLGQSRFLGDGVDYYRPSYYRKLASGYGYTDEFGFDDPIEKLMFGYDFSPLRPIQPYRFESKTHETRPYPVSGDYFTGPWGPLNSVLNATMGRVLKPELSLHEGQVEAGLAQYAAAGASGAVYSPGMSAVFSGLESAGGGSIQLSSGMVSNHLSMINDRYAAAVGGGGGSSYGDVYSNIQPISNKSTGYRLGEFGYNIQELAGIYGFGFATLRTSLGLGSEDFSTEKPVLASSSGAYSTGRSFWNMEIGGLGDFNAPGRSPLGSLEMSEIVRRFIPRERSSIQTVNPISNTMGQQHPWLPGADYFTDFTRGDPYTKVRSGEMRLPGQAYERFHNVQRDKFGGYSPVDQFRVLGDVAPHSKQYRDLDRVIDSYATTSTQLRDIEQTRMQVAEMGRDHHFTNYKYRYSSPSEIAVSPVGHAIGSAMETFAHADTILHTKFLQHRTATEDWERDYVYGTPFPMWQSPISDFVMPSLQKGTQRSVGQNAAYMALIGSLFGRGAAARSATGFAGGVVGAATSMFGKGYQAATGDRFIPTEYKKRMAVEEYSDILSYVKFKRLENAASSAGDARLANQFRRESESTMYGVNLMTTNIQDLIRAAPKQKREHFEAMLFAPEQERERILSTAPRLERRIFQAAWGMEVEELPDLDTYFETHELPGADWEGWSPNVNEDSIKIKIAQSLGADLSEMGYYPQQIREANLLNPVYPEFRKHASTGILQDLKRMIFDRGARASVIASPNPFGQDRFYMDEQIVA